MEMDCGFCIVREDGLYRNGVKVDESEEELAKRFAGAMKEAMDTAWIIDDGALKTPLKMVKLEKRYNEKSVYQSRLTAEDVRRQLQDEERRNG